MGRLDCYCVVKVLNSQVAEVNVFACDINSVRVQGECWEVVEEGTVVRVVNVNYEVLDGRVEKVVEGEVVLGRVHKCHTVNHGFQRVAKVEEVWTVVLPVEDYMPPPPVAVSVYYT